MKAIVQNRYGSPRAVCSLRDVVQPAPASGEVLVKVRAAGVNISDSIRVTARPFIRLMSGSGVMRPKIVTPGKDIAGTVETVGDGVTRFRTGDEVFGRCTCAFAEYACAAEGDLLSKPQNASFEEAAALGISAMTALQAMRDHGKVRAGQKVLVNGASGGVGTFAVQIAKWLGAEVTGVCSTRNVELVRGLGADRVVDYTREDFTLGEERYDVILDNAGSRSPGECLRVLAPQGVLLLNGGGIAMGRGDGLVRGLIGPTLEAKRRGQPGLMPVLKWNIGDLAILKELVESGKVRPAIDSTYPLARAAEALEMAGAGRARGKIVITV
jgi:NADPH:quinone reductase-like Zn-dependent oxidoreductase